MDTALKTHKRKIYYNTAIVLSLLIFITVHSILIFLGIILHNGLSVINTRAEFMHYTNVQSRLKHGLETKGWQPVSLNSQFGYVLEGTFIPNPTPSNKTVIFVHGIAATQAMGLHVLDMYLDRGYNLLIYDSRNHGASGGPCVTWGYYEQYDLDQWVDWLEKKQPDGVIGVHGVSLGAATAVMHSVLNESSGRVQFYVADSAYSDLAKLLEQQLAKHTRSTHLLWIDILINYASLVAYIQSDFAYASIRPVAAMGTVTTPILYLHGEADTLVPVEMSLELANATNGYRELHTFPGIKHGRAVLDSKQEYQAAVAKFLAVIGH
ncbi:alpha/beta hydrolase [Sporomusa termitida]|uniref:Serine aminopeptidase, S33 n=1 Tax=Sporomusa termitida TaxID=2377 RepID=A0A517DW99_9FIRM|nr:alpha/beta hydrolase [Sporomusa termitida]QDR81617.1 Serine aminopeptidase, S33 [Sporomusa termitida]